jgi:hypothetical protein
MKDKNWFKNLTALVFCGAIFLNYTFNFSRFWLGYQLNDYFLEIAFSLGDLVVILIAIWLIKSFYFPPQYQIFQPKNKTQPSLKQLFSLSKLIFSVNKRISQPGLNFWKIAVWILILLQYCWVLLQSSNQVLVSVWQATLVLCHLILWTNLVFLIYRSNLFNRIQKYTIALILLTYSLTDYFLLRDSQILIFIYLLCLVYSAKYTQKVKNILQKVVTSFVGLNLGLALYQFVFSHSLGLKYLGELVLSNHDNTSAKQEIWHFKILRGYGITTHPVILGFLGVVVLFLVTNSLKQALFGKYCKLLEVFAVILILVSFSRSAWLLAIIIYVLNYLQTRDFHWQKLLKKYWLWLTLSTLALTALFWQRLSHSDIYRLENWQDYQIAFSSTTWWQKLFGIGLGQYSLFLRQNYTAQLWDYVPIHNIFLQLYIELGAVDFILGFVTIIFYFFQSKKSHESA